MNPIPLPPDLPVRTHREVRLWPSSRVGQYRLEFDQRPDGMFSGLWVTSQTLQSTIRRLLPHLTDADINEALDQLAALLLTQDHPTRYLVLRHYAPDVRAAEPTSVDIQDFQFF